MCDVQSIHGNARSCTPGTTGHAREPASRAARFLPPGAGLAIAVARALTAPLPLRLPVWLRPSVELTSDGPLDAASAHCARLAHSLRSASADRLGARRHVIAIRAHACPCRRTHASSSACSAAVHTGPRPIALRRPTLPACLVGCRQLVGPTAQQRTLAHVATSRAAILIARAGATQWLRPPRHAPTLKHTSADIHTSLRNMPA